MNTDDPAMTLLAAERRVLEIQTKLHRWASDEAHRRFDDLYNLVTDPSFLLVAWDRVRHNKGARTAGVDGETAYYIESMRGVDEFLTELRDDLSLDLSRGSGVSLESGVWVVGGCLVGLAACGGPGCRVGWAGSEVLGSLR